MQTQHLWNIMRQNVFIFHLLVVMGLPGFGSRAVAEDQWRVDVQRFLDSHCLDCHGHADGDGGLNLSQL